MNAPGLTELIAEQIVCAEQLIATLEEERLALVDQDAERLTQVCARKLEQARRLQQLGDRLTKSWPSAFAPGDLDGPQMAPAIARQWLQLRQLAQQCEQANRRNGAIVDAHEAQARISLRALQPQSPATYGRRGAAAMQFGSRLHDRA